MRIPLLALLLGAAACSPGGLGPRAAFVQEVLVQDNRIWFSQEPDRVTEKFAAMAADPYDFMRGSVALHFADLARPRAERLPTAFLAVPEATAVLVFGDPHPENFTVCRADPSPAEPAPPLTLEMVDLDAAGFGPWTLDLRRAALGLGMLTAGLDGCHRGCQEAPRDALVAGYVAGLGETGGPPPPGEVVADLVDEGREEGEEDKKTGKYAPVPESGPRRLLRGEETRLSDLGGVEASLLDELLADWADRGHAPAGFRLLDAARRHGSGVSSVPATRFVLLWDRGDEGTADDALMQLREVVDPPPLPGRAVARTAAFADNGQRIVWTSTHLWSRPDADPRLGQAQARGRTFKSSSWTSWFQDVDHTDIAEDWAHGGLRAEDLVDLGFDLGFTLGASHARGQTLQGAPGGVVIRADLRAGGGEAVLAREVQAAAAADRARLEADLALFLDLLDTVGPLLGAETILEEPW